MYYLSKVSMLLWEYVKLAYWWQATLHLCYTNSYFCTFFKHIFRNIGHTETKSIYNFWERIRTYSSVNSRKVPLLMGWFSSDARAFIRTETLSIFTIADPMWLISQQWQCIKPCHTNKTKLSLSLSTGSRKRNRRGLTLNSHSPIHQITQS